MPPDIADCVRNALAEDLGTGDLSANALPAESVIRAQITIREAAVLCGTAWANEVFRQLGGSITTQWHHGDGDLCMAGAVVCTLEGQARALLSGERTALNFLQTLSATATATSAYKAAIEGTAARVLDTRKTLPGLRRAQKYAVLCGGGENHRLGLFDAVLLKENHIMAAGSITRAVELARAHSGSVMIEVEVETLGQVRETLNTQADRLLLDNFSHANMRAAVSLRDEHTAPRKELEASGNVNLDTIRQVAETGVDYISVGAITKHIRATDFSMRVTPGD